MTDIADLLAAGKDSVPARQIPPRMRVIIDNDFSGDPDDLFQLVHHILSPSVEIPVIIGSHLAAGDAWDPSTSQAANARRRVEQTLDVMGLGERYTVLAGAERGLVDRRTPQPSPAAEAIVREAHRDSDLPLFIACGAGLTDLASAYLIDPSIADRMTAIWVGGGEHEGHAPVPPGVERYEYNHGIDPVAAQVVFNDSDIPLWQVPRNAYRQHLVSHAELVRRVAPHGPIGSFLLEEIERIQRWTAEQGRLIGETYVMGDSPLVTLTALQSSFHPEPASSSWVEMPRPAIDDLGDYVARPGAAPIRVFTSTDTRLTWDDFAAKLESFDRARRGAVRSTP